MLNKSFQKKSLKKYLSYNNKGKYQSSKKLKKKISEKKKKNKTIKHFGGQILPTTCSDYTTTMCNKNFGCRQPFWSPNCR